MPSLLLLLALLVLGEGGEKVLALLDFLLRVGVDDLGEILHESEVGTHGVSEPGELAELWDQSDFISSLPVLVDEERLVRIGDVLIVPGLVVLSVAHLSAVLVEGRGRAHAEVDSLNTVCFLVVASDDSATGKSCGDSFLPVTAFLFGLVTQLGDVTKDRIGSHDLEGDIDVEQCSSLLHDHSGVESRPHLDVVSIKRVSCSRVE